METSCPMSAADRRARAGVALLLAAVAVPISVSPVAATDVSDEAGLRAAWADPAETLVVLRADITLSCEPGQPERTSDTSIVVSGNGFTLTQPCAGHDGLRAAGDGAVTLRNLTLAGGPGTDDGIEAGAAVELASSTVTGFGGTGVESTDAVAVGGSLVADNGVRGLAGAAGVSVAASAVIDNGDAGVWTGPSADASLTDSTVSGNGLSGVDAGGAVAAVRSTIAGNGAGGIVGTSIALTNSTLVANGAFGAQAAGDIDAVHSTISDHEVNLVGAPAATISLFASALVDGGVNCVGAVADAGFNFVDDDSCAGIAANAADPRLGPLAGNGGPTPTRVPGEGSPLVDAVPAESCTAVTGDQRGVLRPQGAACEIGSVEVGLLEPPPAPSPGAPTPPPAASARPSPATGRLPDTAVRGPDSGLTLGVLLATTVTAAAARARGRRSGPTA